MLTVTFSNHTGYGATRGPVVAPDDVREVLLGVEERGAFPGIDAVLSGYQGAETIGEVVLDAVGRVKAANPSAVYCCDPVLGDVGRGVLRAAGDPGVHARPRRAGRGRRHAEPVRARVPHRQRGAHARRAARRGRALRRATGPRTVLVTSVQNADTPEGSIEMVCVSDEGAWSVATPMLDMVVRGGGDATAAIFLAHLLRDGARAALSRTAASMYAVLEATDAAGGGEMRLVENQDAIAHPDERFALTDLA